MTRGWIVIVIVKQMIVEEASLLEKPGQITKADACFQVFRLGLIT